VRYNFLAETTRSVSTDTVAVGHTVDDNVETILMNLLRGSGTRGLRGLRSRSDIFGLVVLRPLLSASRQDTARYCRQNRLEVREDTSNRSLLPLRNRIRLELLPRLKEYNLQIEDALLRAAAIATTDIDFIDKATIVARDRIVKKQNGFFILSKGRFNRLHTALKRGLLRLLMRELLGDLMDIEAGHVEGVLSSLDKQTGKKIILPGGLVFVIDYEHYILGKEPLSLSPFPFLDGEYELNIPGDTLVPNWRVTANAVDKPLSKGQDRFQACLDFDKVGTKLVVRTRRRGDRFRPLGMGAETRLSCFMINTKIPQAWRDSIPLVCSEEGIVWVVGYRPDEGVKVTEDTKRALLLGFKPR
jgi:tRNA(Ile)-lysidine synthase